MKRFLQTFLFLFFAATAAWAQQASCPQNLRIARSLYESGRLHEVAGYLQSCQTSSVLQERIEAFKLLCLTHIYLEEPQKADEYMLKLLQTDHEFTVNEKADPAEFVALYKTFRTKPIYRLGGKVGANVSQPNVKEAVEANEGKSKYKYAVGFHVYGTAEIPLTDKLTFNPSLGFVQKSFDYTNKFKDGDTTLLTSIKETERWLSLPLMIQYKVTKLKIEPYFTLGIQVDYLLGTNALGSRERTGYQFIQEETFDFKPLRKSLNISANAGAGGRLKFGGGYLVGEVTFSYGFSALSSKASAFKNNDMAFRYAYADNIFSLNALSVSAGYVYNIYNPKKINK
jgi:hypothetical protein